MKSWDEFKARVRCRALREEEKCRVEEEFALIEKRGWERYFPLIINILWETDRRLSPVIMGGSALDSFSLRLLTKPYSEAIGFLSNKNCKEIFFNDALRLTFDVVWSDNESIVRDLLVLDGILKDCLSGSGFYEKEVITNIERQRKEERMIISTSPIPEEDVALIQKEKKESTPEEAERLRRYLIIGICGRNGI